ncbi:hypothetical protein LMG23992_05506 [Cupriavidus laharis]|uniref:Uncharacterized protein n=1 Tax=Cupriavidus laharis TaxID=151654 RepID=A0ABM8XXZ1_9BURK|nr:hypothetical protein LMG23992_05506 [Cupriavidus laharis]
MGLLMTGLLSFIAFFNGMRTVLSGAGAGQPLQQVQ